MTISDLKANRAKKFNLLVRYLKHRMPEDWPIERHISNMKTAAINVEMAGWALSEEIKMAMLLASLPDLWWSIEVNKLILMIHEDEEKAPTLDTLTQQLRCIGQEKAHQEAIALRIFLIVMAVFGAFVLACIIFLH